MSMSPQQVVDTADGLIGLAAILKDPEAYQAKLTELQAHAKEGNEAFDKANTYRTEANKTMKDAAVFCREAEDRVARAEENSRVLENAVSHKENILTQSTIELNDKINAAEQMQREVQTLRDSLASKESEAKSRLLQVTSMQKDLENKLADAVSKSSYYDTLITKVKASLN